MKFLQFLGGLDAGGAVNSIVDVSEIISISNTYALRGVTTIQLRNKENVYSTEHSMVLIDRLDSLLKGNKSISERYEPVSEEEVLNVVNSGPFNAIGYNGNFQRFDGSNIEPEEWDSFRSALNDFVNEKGFYYLGLTSMLRKEQPTKQPD